MLEKILDSGYIDGYYDSLSWKEQKENLIKKYKKIYYDKKIKIMRVKTDTKGLRCYIVKEVK